MRHGHSTTSSPSSTHRDKRPFQPSITSFLARDNQDELENNWEGRGPLGPTTRSQHHARERERAVRDNRDNTNGFPSVPGTVQADLLSVGMRVRKSVPEGYKTYSKPAALPSIQTTLAKSHITTTATSDAYSVKPPRDVVPDALQHQRELLPFCGLHRIGGYAEQPVTNVHLYGGTDASGDKPVNIFPLPAEAFNQPFHALSQDSDSSVSSESLSHNTHKRSWHDDDAQPLNLNSNFLFALPLKVSEDDVPVSPHSEAPTHSLIDPLPQTALRPFAQPKTRRQTKGRVVVDLDGGLFKESDIDMEIENAEQSETRASDFGEAEFLVRPWSSGREVEMGGV